MRWWAILLPAAVLSIALPQPAWFDPYLLPSPVIFRGTVVDTNNQPLAHVRISGVEKDGEFLLPVDAGDDGRFNLLTRSPSLVFRKDGFEGRFVRVSSSENARVELNSLSAGRFPECASKVRCGAPDVFCIPDGHGLRRKDETGRAVIDAWVETFSLSKPGNQRAVLTHGAGPSWRGEPRLKQIWSSVKYTEQQKQVHRLTVIDARGTNAAGKLWRNVGVDYTKRSGGEPYQVGESLFYEDRTPKEAALFDQVLDNLCANPSAPK